MSELEGRGKSKTMNWQTYFVCNFCNEPFKTRVGLKGHKWEKHFEAFKAVLSLKSVRDAQSWNQPVVDLEDVKIIVFGEREPSINNSKAAESGGHSSKESSDRDKETDNCTIVQLQPSVLINERVESEGSAGKKLSECVKETTSCSPSELQPRVQTNRQVDSGLSSNEESTESVKETTNSSSNEIQLPVQIGKRVESEGSCSKKSAEGMRGTVICSLSDVRSSVQINERVDTEGSSSKKSTESVKETANCSPNELQLLVQTVKSEIRTEGVKETANSSLTESQAIIQINERFELEGSSSKESLEGVKETANLNEPSSVIAKNTGEHTYLKDPPAGNLTCLSQEQNGEEGGKRAETSASQAEPQEVLTASSDRICFVAKRKIQATDSSSESPSKHLKSSPNGNPITNYPEGKSANSLQTAEILEHLPDPVLSAVDRVTPLRDAENNATNRSSPMVVRCSPRLNYRTTKGRRFQKLFGMGKTSSMMENHPKPVIGKRRKIKRNGVEWYDKKKSVVTKPAFKYCIACRQKFTSSVGLNAHFQAEHKYQKPELPCAECDLKFWNEWRLNQHIKKLHSSIPRERNNSCIYTCEECLDQFGRAESLRRHLLDKHGIEEGPNESNIVPTASGSSLKPTGSHDGSEFDHVEVSKGKFLCTHCDEHFSSQRAWHSHVENVHQNKHLDIKKGEKTDEGLLEYATMPKLSPQGTASQGPNDATTPSPRKETCPVCQEKFQYRREVESHIKKKHRSETKSTAHGVINSPAEIPQSDVNSRAKRRILGSIPIKFGCPLCSAEFEGRDLQVSHLQAVHHFNEADTQDFILHGVDADILNRGNDSRSMKSSQMVDNNRSRAKCHGLGTDLAKRMASHSGISHRSKETVRGQNGNADVQDKEETSCGTSTSGSSSSPSSDSSSSSSSGSYSAEPLVKYGGETGQAKSSAKNSKVRNPANKKKKGEKCVHVCQQCNRSFSYETWYKRHLLTHRQASGHRAFKTGRIKENIPKNSKENTYAARKKKMIDLNLTCSLCEGKFACQDVLRDHLISNHRVKKEAVENMVEEMLQKAKAALAPKKVTERRSSSCKPSARSSKIQPTSARKKNNEKVAPGFRLESNVTFPSTSNPSNMESNFRNADQDHGNAPIQIIFSMPASMVHQGNFPSVERLTDGINALIRNEVPPSNEESPGKGYLGQNIKREGNDGYIFGCDVCGIRYDSQDKLDEHQKCHLVKEKLYQCQECLGKYTSRKRLQNHLLIKHRL